MKSEQDFRAFFEADLRPILEALDARRRKLCAVLGGLLGAVVLIAGVFLLFMGAQQGLFGPMIVVAVGVAIMGFIWAGLTRGFVQAFKQQVITAIVQFCDPSLIYHPAQHIPKSRFVQSRLFLQGIDRYRGEDYVAGTVDKTAVVFSEVHAEYKTVSRDSKGRRREQWHTIFKGVLFIADFNKHFAGETVVLPDTAQRLFGFLGQKLQEMNPSRGELVKLEDSEFEKEFVVYGSDQVEARYLLSTSLMKRIMDYRKKTGRPLCLSFVDSSIFVALTTGRDFFEPRLFRSLMDFETCVCYLDDLKLVLNLVEDLNLNTRIWTKA